MCFVFALPALHASRTTNNGFYCTIYILSRATNALYNDFMPRWKWSYTIGGIVLLLILGSFLSPWAVRFYLTQQVIPDLENKFQLQVQTSRVELNFYRGVLIRRLRVSPLQPNSVSKEFSADQILLWAYPWQWWQNKEVEFHYQIEGIQQANLKIEGKGIWDRNEKILTLEPVLEGPSLTSLVSPLKTSFASF